MHTLKGIVPQSIKNVYHLLQAVLANIRYGFPSRNIKVIGVTGTNGKTTTVQMITKILEEAGKKVAMASTINFRMNGKEEINKTKFTTLSSFSVQKFIKNAVDEKCEYVVLETSSHSLDQCRVWGVEYDVAVITNVTREHLDYHKTMEKYRLAKAKLFKMLSKDGGVAIVNMDMENPGEYLGYEAREKFGYSAKMRNENLKNQYGSDKLKLIEAENIGLGVHNTRYKIQNTGYELKLPGLFNLENALAATCVGLSQDIDAEVIKRALEGIEGVPGRMESVPNSKVLNIIIDYAVTPDSLEKLYGLIKDIKKDSKVIAVFGSCGERDRGKRPIMGKIVSRYADYVIVTNEDPYYEDPQRIIDEVSSGVEGKILEENFWKIFDRREAISKALSLAKEGDFVVITGKGAEETMAIGDKRIPWNDRKVVLEELAR